ncbi:hypothetical protein PFDG_05093 [Plasmodium falciparum Dd2]|uniref:Uncharacterized protein n=1 Tax=Plasmodium falciparum (isolate Dd2) TaxID=57267 RepID=A0A0L7M9P6_PLAF4|nr:hypothetical protein PFDG_05093 [Plasmodium falciparum Dd2]
MNKEVTYNDEYILDELIRDSYSIEKHSDAIIHQRHILQERYETDGNNMKITLSHFTQFFTSNDAHQNALLGNYIDAHIYLESNYSNWITNNNSSSKLRECNNKYSIKYRETIHEKNIPIKCKNLYIEKNSHNSNYEFNELLDIKYDHETHNIYLHPLHID